VEGVAAELLGVPLQGSLGDYLFQLMVLGHPLLWMWLLDNGVAMNEREGRRFYALFMFFAAYVVADSGFSVGYYTTELIVLYIAMAAASTYIFNARLPIAESVCLGFLTVQLNSVYWELPLHVAELLSAGPHVGMLVQAARLLPLLYFRGRVALGRRGRRLLLTGFAASTYISLLKVYIFPPGLGFYVLSVARVTCLLLLTAVVLEGLTAATPREAALPEVKYEAQH